MSAFTNQEQLYSVMKVLWQRIKADESISSRLLESRLVVRFIYRDPEGCLTIDGSDGQDLKILVDNTDVKPVVELEMAADVAHQFWMGREYPAVAFLQGRVVSRGPVDKALALLPAIRPAFRIYPDVLKEAM